MNVEQLLTVRQLAQEAQNSEAFWRKLIARREIPVVRVGRSVRIRRRDVEAWLRARTQPMRAEAGRGGHRSKLGAGQAAGNGGIEKGENGHDETG